jgi:hypothetical protein
MSCQLHLDIQRVADELCARARVRPVRARVMSRGPICALHPASRHLRVNRDEFDALPAPWQRAIIAHEVAHLRLRDGAPAALLVMLQVAALAAMAAACLAVGLALAGFVGALWAGVPLLCILALSDGFARQSEELACDLVAGRLTGDPLSIAESLRALGGGRYRPWQSHPPIGLRIRLAERAARRSLRSSGQ